MITLQLAGFVSGILDRLDVPLADPIGSLLSLLIAFVVLYYVGTAVVLPIVDRTLRSRAMDEGARKPLNKVAWFVVVFVALAAAFGLADYGGFLQSLATVAAAATLAIGFALQDVISNFVAGVFIFTDKPFRNGDWIEWDGNAGTVEDISLRVTRVRTFDNELLTVSNSELTSGVVKNPVDGDQLRLKFVFGIGYDDDIEKATEIIIEEAENHPDIMDDPAPSVRMNELGDSSVGLQSRIWIADPRRSDFVRIRGEYVTAVKQRFDEEGINIPYPNRTIGGGLELSGVDGVVEPSTD
ncbi:MAG: mechanosensitive ion channel family protein [Halobacteriales archaeon]